MKNDLMLFGGEHETLMMERALGIVNVAVDYKELLMMYSCAIKEVRTKFDVLDTEFACRYQRNPISFIKTRLKSNYSIIEKMEKKGLAPTTENIREHLHDIAGVRVICTYIDDIYKIADSLIAQNDITLIEKKDYIANPKPNGYRSLHLIVSVPVFFAETVQNVKVEVQIRTIAMDHWASLEHQMKYKKKVEDVENIQTRLKRCADIINQSDMEMLAIRQQIDETAAEPSTEEILFEKVKKVIM